MINFMRYRLLYLLISGLVLIPGIFSLARFGLTPAIDFTGGTLVELQFATPKENTAEIIRTTAQIKTLDLGSIQKTANNSYIIRMKPVESLKFQEFKGELEKELGTSQEVRYETVGPTLGQELLKKTFIAALIAASAILLYVAYSFKNIRFGAAAVLALLHDLLVVIGVFSILGVVKGVEIDALFVTAILTTMSFSVHDTIVVFDKIREQQKKKSDLDITSQVNLALTETMGRSLNNSLTIIFMLLALFLMGGVTTKWFVLALLIGTISGTYSSPFVATPILYTWYLLDLRRGRK